VIYTIYTIKDKSHLDTGKNLRLVTYNNDNHLRSFCLLWDLKSQITSFPEYRGKKVNNFNKFYLSIQGNLITNFPCAVVLLIIMYRIYSTVQPSYIWTLGFTL